MSVILKSVRHSGLLACAGLAGLLLASPAAFAQAPPPTTTSFQNCTTTQVATPTTITQHRHAGDPDQCLGRGHFGRDRQRQHRFPHPARQRFRIGPRRSRAGPARRRRVGARRRRPGKHRLHLQFRRRVDPGRRRDQHRDHQLRQQADADLRGRAGRHRHRAPQLRRLESPPRHHRRLSQLADHRQRRLRQRFRSPVLGHLFRRHQGTLLRRPDGSPGVLQHQPEQPGLRLYQPAHRRPRLVDLGIDRLQFRSRPGLVHRAVRWLHLFQDLGGQFHRAPRRRSPTSPASPVSFRPTTSPARSVARRCGSARPSQRRT